MLHPCSGTRAVFLEAAVSFISVTVSSDSRGKRAWSTTIAPVFEQNEDFHRRKNCAVVFQSGGYLPPFAVVATELYLNMSTYPRRNSSGLLA